MEQPRILVVYYSLSGTTKALAQTLASALQADLEEIVPAAPAGQGFRLYLKVGAAMLSRQPWTVQPSPRAVASYDLVVIGGPVWAGQMAAPVRGWLRVHALATQSNLAVFATLGGTDTRSAFAELARLAGRQPLAELAIRQADRSAARQKELVEGFVRTLQQGAKAAPRS